MELTLTPNLESQQQFADLAREHSPLVKEVIDSKTAKGTWDIVRDDRGRDVLVLDVHDSFDGEAHIRFEPGELRREEHLRQRLYGTKGALLQIGQWRGQLRELYQNIRTWVEALPHVPYVEEQVITLIEQLSGPYRVTALRIAMGDRYSVVTPIARWIVGAEGRVDLKGTEEDFVLVLQRGAWFWVDRRRTLDLPPLTQELFSELLSASIGSPE